MFDSPRVVNSKIFILAIAFIISALIFQAPSNYSPNYKLSENEGEALANSQNSQYQINISLDKVYQENPYLEKYYNSTGYYYGCKPGYGRSIRPSNVGLGLIVFDGVLVGFRSFYGVERGRYPWTDQNKGDPLVYPPNPGENSSKWSIYTHTLFLTDPPTREECEQGYWSDKRSNVTITSVKYNDILELNPGYKRSEIPCKDCAQTDGYGVPEKCTVGKGHYIRPDPLPGHALYVWNGKLMAVEETWDVPFGWYPWAEGDKDNILVKKYGNKNFYKQTIWLEKRQIKDSVCNSETYNYSMLHAPYGPQYNDKLVSPAKGK